MCFDTLASDVDGLLFFVASKPGAVTFRGVCTGVTVPCSKPGGGGALNNVDTASAWRCWLNAGDAIADIGGFTISGRMANPGGADRVIPISKPNPDPA